MGLDIGQSAPDFTLEGTDGNFYSLSDFDDKQAIVVIFTCNHCPYVQAYEERITALQEDFSEDCQVICINANDAKQYPEDSFEEMVERADEQEFNFIYLRDGQQEIARLYGATHTPEVFLLDAERRLQYRGRIDDNWREPERVTDKTLRKALRALLNGDDVSTPLQPAIGCTIKWSA